MAIVNPKASPLDPSVPGGMDSLPINNICGTPICDSDIEEPIVIVPTSNTLGREYVGTSETDKPMNVQQYSIYHELDTGKNYYYDNGQWNEIPCCSGGGGDSDFSTAQVTIVRGSQNIDGGVIPMIAISSNYDEIAYLTMNASDPGTFQVVLYKGKQVLESGLSSIESVSGSITYDDEEGIYIITGDCTITIYQPQL